MAKVASRELARHRAEIERFLIRRIAGRTCIAEAAMQNAFAPTHVSIDKKAHFDLSDEQCVLVFAALKVSEGKRRQEPLWRDLSPAERIVASEYQIEIDNVESRLASLRRRYGLLISFKSLSTSEKQWAKYAKISERYGQLVSKLRMRLQTLQLSGDPPINYLAQTVWNFICDSIQKSPDQFVTDEVLKRARNYVASHIDSRSTSALPPIELSETQSELCRPSSEANVPLARESDGIFEVRVEDEKFLDTSQAKAANRHVDNRPKSSILISTLIQHHEFENGSILKWEPIGCNELARNAGVAGSTASGFLKHWFRSYREYVESCRSKSVRVALTQMTGESILVSYGRAPELSREDD